MIHRVGLFIASLAAAGALVVALTLAGFAPGGGCRQWHRARHDQPGTCGRGRPVGSTRPGRHDLPGRSREAGDGHRPPGRSGIGVR